MTFERVLYIIIAPFYLIDKKMTTIRWAILFFWLLIILSIFWPWIVKYIFDKDYRKELRNDIKKEEEKKTEAQKKKEEMNERKRWIITFVIGVIIYIIFFK